MAQYGVSIVSTALNSGVSGLSIVSTSPNSGVNGVSLVSNNNVYVLICDDNLTPVSAQIEITGGSDVDGVYSGFDEYAFTTGSFSNINIEASATGFITNDATVDFDEFGNLVVKIELLPDTTTFTCETLFKNKFGITIDKPLLDGFVEVEFSGSSPFDKSNYILTFEAILSGGTKYASIVLDSELIDEQPDSLTYKVSTVQIEGDYCYLSNISKKLC